MPTLKFHTSMHGKLYNPRVYTFAFPGLVELRILHACDAEKELPGTVSYVHELWLSFPGLSYGRLLICACFPGLSYTW